MRYHHRNNNNNNTKRMYKMCVRVSVQRQETTKNTNIKLCCSLRRSSIIIITLLPQLKEPLIEEGFHIIFFCVCVSINGR